MVSDEHTKFREGNQLAAILASLVDPVDSLLDGEFEVEPSRLSVDGSSLVLLDSSDHVEDVVDGSERICFGVCEL